MIKLLTNSTLFKSAGIYTFSRIVSSVIPFLLLPIMTRYLSPTDYGMLAMFFVLLGIVSPFVGLSFHGAIGIRYFDKNGTDLPNYIGNCFFLLAISSTLVLCSIHVFADPISRLTAFPREWLWSVVILAAGQVVIRILMTLWQVENKPLKYGIFENLQSLINISLSVLLVVGLRRNWQGRIEAQIVTILVFAFGACFLLYKNGWLKFSYEKSYINDALKFGVPLIPHELGAMLIVQTDRMFITNMIGVADTGIYTVGFQIAYIIELLAVSFNLAYSPWLYKQLTKDNFSTKKRIVKLTYLYFGSILIFAMIFSVFAPWFLSFFVGKDFIGAGKYTVWFALGFSFSGMYYMVANYIFYSKKTTAIALVTFFTAMVNIMLNYVLIKRNGAVGAAQASALAFFMSFVLTWILSSKVYSMPWNLKGKG